MGFLTQNFSVTGGEVLFFLLIMLVVLFLAHKRSKRIKYLEMVQVKTIDDNIAFRAELIEKGYSEDEIQALRNKYEPEKDML